MLLEVRHVSCGYGSDNIILEDCDFSVSGGEICCLLGPNGVGKTTLFKTVLQLIKPLSGQVCINGEDCSSWSPAKLAGSMAYVAQQHRPIFAYKVKDVVMMGRFGRLGYFGNPNENDEAVVENVLNEMGLATMSDRSYINMSGGERQLVLIARALAQQPAFLVLDEPTAGLDYSNSVRVLKKIIELKEAGYGIIMTTHSPDHAFLCDANVLILSRKRPLVFGKASDVVTEENLFAAYNIPIRVVEFYDENNRVMHLCAPRM